MVLIKTQKNILLDSSNSLIHYWRNNPVVAANHILRRDGEPVVLAPIQEIMLTEWWFCKFSINTASRGSGKALTLDTKVLTTEGFVPMRDITLDHKVITPKGTSSPITGIYPQGVTDVYEITFADGRTAKCSPDHLWTVIGVGGLGQGGPTEWQTHDLLTIKEFLEAKAKIQHQSVRVPLVEGVFPSKKVKVEVPPYLLGALIGDGNLTHYVGLSSADEFIVEKIRSLLPPTSQLVKRSNLGYCVINKVRNNKRSELSQSLDRLGLMGKKSFEKYIPDPYMSLSRKQTLELLQGLFDTDGTVEWNVGRNKKSFHGNRVSYCTTSFKLAAQIRELIWRLGGVCKISEKVPKFIYKGEHKIGRKAYILNIRYKRKRELFSLPRKLSRLSRADQYSKNLGLAIVSINKVEPAPTQCIKIEDPEGLFIIDDYVVTHNTFVAAVYAALQAALFPGARIGIFAPAFRQAKFIFKEFTRLYNESPLLQDLIDKPPIQQNDQCICIFKSIGQKKATSEIKALPTGPDGGKIRGERFKKIILDEIVHLPETAFRSAIQPMLSTSVNPMQKVREVAEQNRKSTPFDFLSDNGYVGITSGYFQFNYWWQEVLSFWDQIQRGNKAYNLRFTPYTELPSGFYDSAVVEDARLNAPQHMFLTEWMAEWISDSEGAFPMSLLESARDDKLIPKAIRDPDKDKGKAFVFGIDAARERDSTAIVVSELGYPSKVVHIVELEETPFPEQARQLFLLIDRFQPVMIYMDEYGGGQTLRDLLAEPEGVGFPSSYKVIEQDAELSFSGKRILKLCNFNPNFIEDANNNAKTLLEQRVIKLPSSINPIEGTRKSNIKGQSREIDLVQELINQVASVVVTSTPSGKLHYDLPKGSTTGSSRPKKKDLYTAFILVCKCIYDLEWKPKADRTLIQSGVVKEIGPAKQGVSLTGELPSGIIHRGGYASGVNQGKVIVPRGGVIVPRRDGKKI